MAKDLRLLVPALSLWAGTALVFWIEARVWWPIVGLLIGYMLLYRRGMLRIALVLSCVGVASGALRVLPLLHDMPPAKFESQFVVVADTSRHTTAGSADFGARHSVRIDVISVDSDSAHIPAMLTNIEVPLNGIGSRWTCRMTLRSTHVLYRFSAFARCHSPPTLIADAPRYQKWADAMRDSFAQVTYQRFPEDPAAALLPALVEGDTRGQSTSLNRTMQQAGLGHLTAVSGANVAILFAALTFALRRTRLRPSTKIALQLVALVAFVILARPTASVVRAAVMAAAGLSYWFFGRRKYAEVVLLVSVFGLLLIDPWLSVSWGFALSVAATLGLILLPLFFDVHGRLSQMVLTALAATLATTPLLIVMGTQPTFATIPANVLAEVFVAPATIFGFVTLVFASLSSLPIFGALFTSLATLAAWPGIKCAAAVIWIAQHVNATALSLEVVSWQGLLAVACGCIAFLRLSRWRVLLAVATTLFVVVISTQTLHLLRPWPLHDWDLVACDVGQGDATVIKVREGEAVVVDAGGDDMKVDTCLSQLGISHVVLFVASHFHADHVGGFHGVAKNRTIDALLIPPQSEPHFGFALLAESHIPTKTAKVGDKYTFAGVDFQVLQVGPAIAHPDDGTEINNSSIVLLLTLHGRRVLLTGDIEISAQEALLRLLGSLKVDLVKIAHHGSRYQSPDFALQLHPALAWASVGEGNPYGHPALETLNAYRAEGAHVVTTMDCGSIAFALGEVLRWAGSRPCHA
ncbi:MAG: hypothetical protein RIS43_1032 [Actinomycetota bacterium]